MRKSSDLIGMVSTYCFLINAAQAAALDLGLVPESGKSIESAKFVYLMGADDVNMEKGSS